MRCPYCGGLNADQAQFCRYCGRSFGPPTSPGQPASRQTPPQRPPYQQPQGPAYSPPRPPQQITPVQAPSYRRPDPNPPAPPAPAEPQYAANVRRRRQSAPATAPATLAPTAPPAPELPAPFPPRNMDQLRALEPGALAYTLLRDEIDIGHKKIIRIAYPRCSAWQQVATLLKAFREYQTEQFNTIVIQGVVDQDSSVYAFSNGQLWFDRHVRLGSQLINRYQIETGTGLESDSVRIVLAEE
jgi:hypothetical protein